MKRMKTAMGAQVLRNNIARSPQGFLIASHMSQTEFCRTFQSKPPAAEKEFQKEPVSHGQRTRKVVALQQKTF